MTVNNTDGVCAEALLGDNPAQNLLIALYSYDTYAILRPSMVIDAN